MCVLSKFHYTNSPWPSSVTYTLEICPLQFQIKNTSQCEHCSVKMDKTGKTQQKLRFSGLKVYQCVYLFTSPYAPRNTGTAA